MGELLAALVFGVIIFGFTALMLIPLFFAWLMVAVYHEPWGSAVEMQPVADGPPVAEAELATGTPPEVEAEPERPKVMAAGQRRPLP